MYVLSTVNTSCIYIDSRPNRYINFKKIKKSAQMKERCNSNGLQSLNLHLSLQRDFENFEAT